MTRPIMKQMSWGLWAAVVVLAGVPFGGRAEGAIVGADDPNAYTFHQMRKERLDYGRRTLVEAYKSVGKRDAKWDGPAIKALEALARYFANGAVEQIYKADVPAHEEILAAADAAIAAGCDDPMIIYAKAAMLNDTGRADEARPLLEKALAGAQASKYPPFRVASIATRLVTFLDPKTKPQERAEWMRLHNLVLEQAVLAFQKNVVGTKDHRHVLAHFDDEFAEAPLEVKATFVRRLEQAPDTDPWLLHLHKGIYHVKAAWAARGGGWAHTVAEEGWRKFYEELGKARDHLVKSHGLHPEYPEAATEMIAVAMGAGRQINERERDWFDKATKAQLDYYPAYNSYTWSIYPRWGGGHRQMFEFGMECLNTRRYDTYVPYQLMIVCEKINRDADDNFTFYAFPPIYPQLKAMFEGLEQKAPKHLEHAWYQSYHLAVAWRARRYEDAAALIKRIERFDPEPFEKVRAWPAGALSEIQAMTSPHGRKLQDAERNSAAAKTHDIAIAAYQEVLGEMGKEKDHPGLLYVRYRLKQLQLEKDFYGGKEVSLAASANALAPWFVGAGELRAEKEGGGTGLVATTKDDGERARALCKADFGNGYELSAKVDWPDPQRGNLAALYVGVAGPMFIHVIIDRTGTVTAAGGYESRTWPTEVKDVNEVVLRVQAERMTVRLNGEDVGTIRVQQTPTRDVHVGVGIPTQRPGRAARFTDVKIKRRVEAPGERDGADDDEK